MKGKQAQPGKPGEWNGRPMRWRRYKRAIQQMAPEHARGLLEKEIAWKARLVRLEAVRRVVRTVALALVAVAVVGGLVTIQCVALSRAATVEKGSR
jgi:hypothetical protein